MYSNRIATTMLATLALLVVADSARAQQFQPPPDVPPIALGSLILAPVLQVNNLGWDSNVFNLSDDQDVKSDTTLTFSPIVSAWYETPRTRLSSYGQVDLVYFRTLADLRGVDGDVAGKLEFPINRLTPFVRGQFTSTRHRQNAEIDAIVRRTATNAAVGTAVNFSERTQGEVFVSRASEGYDDAATFLDSNLADRLNFQSTGYGASVAYQVTPLTSVGVQAERSHDGFDNSSERDSNNLSLMPYVAFQPRALISGTASFGILRRTVPSKTSPDFTGTVATVDLTYTLYDRTRFTFNVDRRLQYSYLNGLSDYLETAFSVRVQHQLTDAFDAGPNFSIGKNHYRVNDTPGAASYPDENYLAIAGTAGYRMRRTRLGVVVEHRQRSTSPDTNRNYGRLRAGATVTYTF